MGTVPIMRQRLARKKNMGSQLGVITPETFQNELEELVVTPQLAVGTTLEGT